eukprot:COSAG01_NODE_47473_length_389_cov_1645.358621_1_plen_62_part_01
MLGIASHGRPPPLLLPQPLSRGLRGMTSTDGMFAIVYGPADVPAGKTAEEYEASEAQRREEV